jgi:GTP-binding protein
MARPLPLRFVTSADRLDRLPDTRAEVAVVGRSNVGKSSLLNALGNRRNLAHVSKTPGRTRLLNCYEVEPGATLVDCPGYGYAAASKATRAGWPAMIEGYLLGREQLAMVMVLVDGEIGPTPLDVRMLDWLRAHVLPHTVVATKHDKVRSSKRGARRSALAAGCGLEAGDVVWVSAERDVGLDRLRSLTRLWLGLADAATTG